MNVKLFVMEGAKCDSSILTSVQILNYHKYSGPLNSSENYGEVISLNTYVYKFVVVVVVLSSE
jgi:hypothetical protein